MTYIDTVPVDEADTALLAFYRREQGRRHYLPNYARVFCHRPAVMEAWAALQRELRRHLDSRAYALVSLAAARASGSSYCALAYGHRLMQEDFSAEELAAILREEPGSPLTDGERRMMSLAGKVARRADSVNERDVAALRQAGYSDAQIFDVVAAAAGRSFFARVPDALGVLPDAPLVELDDALLKLLLVGRPVSTEEPQGMGKQITNELPRPDNSQSGGAATEPADG